MSVGPSGVREPVRVLLVEDDDDDRLLVREHLASVGGRFQLSYASTVAEGLDALAADVDVCLLDHQLGAQTGIEFLLAARRRGVTVPVVMLTGADDPETDASAIAAGAADFLLKRRLEPWLLERTLVRAIHRAEALADRLRADTALRWSEEHYRRIVETATEGVWVIDANARTTFVNATMAAMLGYAVQEVAGRHLGDFLDAEGSARVSGHLERRRSSAQLHDVRFKRKDGSDLWLRLQANPLFAPDGRYEGSIAMATDITEHRRTEEVQARLAAIVESSEDAIVGKDLDGTITSWNLSAERLYGYTADEAVGRKAEMLVPPDGREAHRLSLARVREGVSLRQFESLRARKDGSTVAVSLTLSPVRDPSGRVIGSAAIARDLTERRRAAEALRKTEAQLWQAQKMEAIGRLAGGVAHDFNNLLSVILGFTDMIRDALEPESPLRADADEVYRAGERAAELTAQLLAFSRHQVIQPQVMDVNHSVREMQRMLQRMLGEDVEFAFLAEPTLGKVRADPGQVEQIVMNLVANARDAMPRGGKLTIETANAHLDADFVAAHPEASPGPHMMLAVTDTGDGMDAETCARIFEPFFTTKEKGRGTGLGLATVFGVVRQSGGTILVYSERGHGTTFKIFLPQTREKVTRPPTQPGPTLRRGHETVLVVEDEESVRAIIRTVLQRHGYIVLEASGGEEAIQVIAEHCGDLHLLLTDVVLPRMSGPEIATRSAVGHPAMKVLYMSGYAEGSIVRHGVLEAGVAFLPKPITPNALLSKVREVLDR